MEGNVIERGAAAEACAQSQRATGRSPHTLQALTNGSGGQVVAAEDLFAVGEGRRGAVVHVSSIQRRMPLHEATHGYAAAKAALTTYSKGIANELGPHGMPTASSATS